MDYWEDEFIIKAFGENVQKSRTKKGLTQRQLADAVGMSVNAIYEIEKGIVNTSITTAAKIAAALDAKILQLFPKQK